MEGQRSNTRVAGTGAGTAGTRSEHVGRAGPLMLQGHLLPEASITSARSPVRTPQPCLRSHLARLCPLVIREGTEP